MHIFKHLNTETLNTFLPKLELSLLIQCAFSPSTPNAIAKKKLIYKLTTADC